MHRSGKLSPLAEPPELQQPDSRTCLPRKGPGAPLPRQNVKSRMSPQVVGIKDPPVPKTAHKRQKILTRQFSLDQEGASMCSLQLSKHESTRWMTVAPPYIPDAVVPAPHLRFVQVKGSQSFLIG
jgi:hypothetical protein